MRLYRDRNIAILFYIDTYRDKEAILSAYTIVLTYNGIMENVVLLLCFGRHMSVTLLVYIDSYKCFELRLPVSINRLRESLSTFGLTQACLSIVWEKFCMYLRVEWAIWSRNTKRMLNINLTATYLLSLLFSTILIINWLLCFTIANVGNELIIFTFPRNWQSVSYKLHTLVYCFSPVPILWPTQI